jgi:hypothetical protein
VEDIRIQREKEKNNYSIKWEIIFSFLNKNKKKILIISSILFIVIFPVESGTFIGQFITDFFGNLIKTIRL